MPTPKQKKKEVERKKKNVPQKRNGDEKHHHTAHWFKERVVEQENAQNNDWKFFEKSERKK